ncbi:MAG: hypothetical protein PHR35_09485 [Kiritimatiellae bacterium]|nr:hypothetical protein [Kiritimatiellia bacterium]
MRTGTVALDLRDGATARRTESGGKPPQSIAAAPLLANCTLLTP